MAVGYSSQNLTEALFPASPPTPTRYFCKDSELPFENRRIGIRGHWHNRTQAKYILKFNDAMVPFTGCANGLTPGPVIVENCHKPVARQALWTQVAPRDVSQSDHLSQNTSGTTFVSITGRHHREVTPEQQPLALAEDPSIHACEAMFSHITLVTGRLERAFFKAYKELERIKTARQKQAQAPDQPEQDQTPDQSEESHLGPAIDLYWVDPKTGERTLAAQTPAAVARTERLLRENPPG
jgi:hypothetical protein